MEQKQKNMLVWIVLAVGLPAVVIMTKVAIDAVLAANARH